MKYFILISILSLASCAEVKPDMSTQEGRNAHWAAQRAISEAESAAWERNCSVNSETKPECQPIDLTANWQ